MSGGSVLNYFHMFWEIPNLYISFVCFLIYFLIGGKLLYSVVLVSIFLNYKISKVKLGTEKGLSTFYTRILK